MALKLASLLCTCIINVVSKRDVHGLRNMFVSESCCRALGRARTGCWCDACKHLKWTSEKQGISIFRSLGFGALNFPVSRRQMPNFRAAFASETFPSLCSMFLYCATSYCATSAQTPKPPATLQSTKMPLNLYNFLVFLLLLYKCCVMCKTEWRLAVFSFLIPRLTSSQRTRDHWGAPRTTAHLMFRITHNIPAILDGSSLWSRSLIQYSHLK